MEEEVKTNGHNVRANLQGRGYYTYSKEGDMNNPEKMERPHPWPDPPEVKLPEITIGCPMCNDREHRMTIFFDSLNDEKREYYIRCDKCLALFKLKRCMIVQTSSSTSKSTPSIMPW